MKILIMSRNDIEKMAEQAFPDDTAVISITDYGDEPVFFQNAPAYIHHVSFDDVESDMIIDELGTHGIKEEKRKIEEKYRIFKYTFFQNRVKFYQIALAIIWIFMYNKKSEDD